MSASTTTRLDAAELEEIALAFSQKAIDQKIVQDRRYHLQTYPQCFLGTDAVTILLEILNERNYTPVSRARALEIGLAINENFDLIRHVTNGHPLKDEALFFEFYNNLPKQVEAARQRHNVNSAWDIMALLEREVEVKDRVYNFRTYKQCWIGQDAVTQVMKLQLTISRQDAVEWIQKANTECPAMEHVCRDHDFQDAYLFFRFIPTKQRMLNPNNQHQTYAAMLDAMKSTGDGNESSMSDFSSSDFSSRRSDADSVVSDSTAIPTANLLPPNTTLEDVAARLERDMIVKDHSYRFKTYKQCFVAKDAVTYMVTNNVAPSRKVAEQLGQQLESQLNLFHHVTNDHKFRDKGYFFRFTPLLERKPQPPSPTDSATRPPPRMPMRSSRMPSKSSFAVSKRSLMTDWKESHMSLEDIAIAFERGMKVQKQAFYRMKAYHNVFSGHNAVKFLIKKGFVKSQQAQDAVTVGRMVQEEFQLFQGVEDDSKPLMDCSSTLYQFVPTEERKARMELRQQLQQEHQMVAPLTTTTTLDSLPEDNSEQQQQDSSSEDEELMEIDTLFRQGVKIRNNKYRGKVYKYTFIGSQAVDFLVNSSLAPSRREAVRLGRRIQQELKTFDHVTRDHEFGDDYIFFIFEEDRRNVVGQGGRDSDLVQSVKRRSTSLSSLGMGLAGPKEALSSMDAMELADADSLPLEQIAKDFRQNVLVKDRRFRFSTYKDVFIGSEAVDYLVGKTTWASSRREAEQLGNTLITEFDLFHHVTKAHSFKDDQLFYRFTDEDLDTMLQRLQSMGDDSQQPALEESGAMTRLIDIAQRLEEGLEPKDNRFRLRVYKSTMVGDEIISFLVDNKLASSRGEALQLGRAVAKHFQLFEHVTMDHPLKDSGLFYKFIPAANRVRGKWFINSFGHKLRDKMIKTAKKRTNLSTQEYWDLVREAVEKDAFDVRLSKVEVNIRNFRIMDDDSEWTRRVRNFETQVSMKTLMSLGSSIAIAPISESSRVRSWSSTFARLDPRQQIHRFYNEVAQTGANPCDDESGESIRAITVADIRPLFRFLPINLASVFTVWRPTSYDAIRKMMLGEAVGKGLDIKGKSAKRGKLSAYVPFLQIGDNKHKDKVRRLSPSNMVRVFYKADGRRARDAAIFELEKVMMDMLEMVKEARKVLASDKSDKALQENALECMLLEVDDPMITPMDDYAPQCYGIELPERLFWEAYFMRQDCTRTPGSIYDSGRPSQPAFQDMNFSALRAEPHEGAPKAVIYQNGDSDDPMNPFELLMAYEEQDRVLPVVSDFDCFLVGTRRVQYSNPLPPDQLEVLRWCVTQIENIVQCMVEEKKTKGKINESKPWSLLWLEVLKASSFHPEIPQFGFGDPISYSIVENAVDRLSTSGAVRHGAECFNYYFPQDLDDEFLLVCENIGGGNTNNKNIANGGDDANGGKNVPWKYVGVDELQRVLAAKIEEGFAFPLNPKWILMDEGWMPLYQKLLHSPKDNIQAAMNVWFPPESGLRDDIDRIYRLQMELKTLEPTNK